MSRELDARLQWLHFEGGGTLAHSLPAGVLIRSVRQLQRIVYLLARFQQGADIRSAAGRDLEDRYGITCMVPELGGYALPVQIGDVAERLDHVESELSSVCERFQAVTRAVGSGHRESLDKAIPDSEYRVAIIAAYKAMQPPTRHGVVCSIENQQREKLLDGTDVKQALKRLSAPSDEDVGLTSNYVTGELIRIDFAKQNCWLKYNGQNIRAAYNIEVQSKLLEHSPGLVQVHGVVHYDKRRNIRHITDVDEVHGVESSLEIKRLHFDNMPYRATPPLRFNVRFDPQAQLYDLAGDFNISAFAESRAELEADLHEELDVLWHEYAQEDPARLSKDARRLQAELKARLVPVL